MPKQYDSSKIASRIFLMIVGIVIAVWLYFINLDDYELPSIIFISGFDITKYAIVIMIIFIGVIAGMFIKYGMRGGKFTI